MILVDTSIWIDHLHRGDQAMSDLLESGEVLLHPYVRVELALGSLHNRRSTLVLLGALPVAPVVSTEGVLALVEARQIYATGLGLTDAHLIASALIEHTTLLWTRDRRLETVASRLGISATTA